MINKETYNNILKALNKIAVFITLNKVDDRQVTYLATRNTNIINDFNAVFSAFEYGCSEDEEYIEVYELRYDKKIRISTADVSHYTFYGIPTEVSPPVYLSERYSGFVTDEQLVDFQRNSFLAKVHQERKAGHYHIEQPHTIYSMCKLLEIKYFFETEFDIKPGDHPLFDFYNELYLDYNIASNSLIASELRELYKSMFFLPAIIACQGDESVDFKKIVADNIDKSIYHGLREKWIVYLYKQRDKFLQKAVEDKSQLESTFTSRLVQDLAPYIPNAEPIIQSLQEQQEELGNFIAWLGTKVYSEVTEATSILDLANLFTAHIDAGLQWDHHKPEWMDSIKQAPAKLQHLKSIVGEHSDVDIITICHLFVDTIHESITLNDQYDLVIQTLNDINIEDHLELYNDYRLYLRYWPEVFPENASFHNSLRPFSVLENRVIKCLLQLDIEFDYDSLYRKNYDYYNSCIDILQEQCITICKEKRLQQIKDVAVVRAEQIRSEMEAFVVNLSVEEKAQLDNVLQELVDFEKYSQALNDLVRLIDVLSYWPAALHPAPTSVL
jgi:hypothetical protein